MLASSQWISAGYLLRRLPSSMAAVLTVSMMGCVGLDEPLLSDRAVMPGYSVTKVQGLAGHTITIEVYGNPFSVPPQAFDGQIAANMNQSAAAPMRFAAHAPGDTAEPYHVVWNFTPPQESIAPNAICRADFVQSNSSGTPIEAYAAFCLGREALSSVRGHLYYADTQNSLEFLRFVDAMTTELFPTEGIGQRRSGDAKLGKPVSHPF